MRQLLCDLSGCCFCACRSNGHCFANATPLLVHINFLTATSALQDAPPTDLCNEKPETLGCNTCTVGDACNQQQCGASALIGGFPAVLALFRRTRGSSEPTSGGFPLYHVAECSGTGHAQMQLCGFDLHQSCWLDAHLPHLVIARQVGRAPSWGPDARERILSCIDCAVVRASEDRLSDVLDFPVTRTGLVAGDTCIPAHKTVTVRKPAAIPEGFGRYRPCCNSTNGVRWTLQSDAGATHCA